MKKLFWIVLLVVVAYLAWRWWRGPGEAATADRGQKILFNRMWVDHLPTSIRGNLGAGYLAPPRNSIKPLDELLTEIERRLIETALAKARQNKSRAAEVLGISRPRLYRRIKELNLPDESEPEEDDHH